MGGIAGAAFAQNLEEAATADAASSAKSPELASSPLRPHLSSTGSDEVVNGSTAEPRVVDFAAGSKGSPSRDRRPSSAASHAFHVLEYGLTPSPQHGARTEKKDDADVKLVELPPTHVEKP